jgi:carbon monoxide dehydrogenase subunit G
VTTVSRSFHVDPPPATVVEYLKDFSHAEQWDPGTERCTRKDSGPIAAGATWVNLSKIAGINTELTYTLKALTENQIVLVGENDSARSTDTITVHPWGTGSEITYVADINMHGAAKVASPAVKVLFERLGSKTEEQMTEVLNRLN